MLYQIQYLVGAKPLTRTQICLCFLQKERKFSPVQTLFRHLPLIIIIICKRANWGRRDLWYTTTWIAIGKFQYWMFPLTTILLRHSFVFLLKALCSCRDHVIFSTISFAIVPSYFYLSPITAVRTELSRHDRFWTKTASNQQKRTNRWELGLTWWLFLSLPAKVYINIYLFLSSSSAGGNDGIFDKVEWQKAKYW